MANFHPRPHHNGDGQLNQSLEQLKQALKNSSNLPPESAQPRSEPGPEDEVLDWEAALESAAADIDNYFKH